MSNKEQPVVTIEQLKAELLKVQEKLDQLQTVVSYLHLQNQNQNQNVQLPQPASTPRTTPAPAPASYPKEVTSTTRTRREVLGRLAKGLGVAAGLGVLASTTMPPHSAAAKFGAKANVSALVLPATGSASGSLASGSSVGILATPDANLNLTTAFPDSIKAGVIGINNSRDSDSYGVYAKGLTGVYGEGQVAVYASGEVYGIKANSTDVGSIALYGSSEAGQGVYGQGETFGATFRGVKTGTGCIAGWASITGTLPFNVSAGLIITTGHSLDLTTFADNQNIGLYAIAGTDRGRKATAGVFAGNVDIYGSVTKGGGSFKIDHPLDPKNKYLYHSFVESPDMLNIYSGITRLGEQGQATVELPDWFEALNRDYRYQLTCLDSYAPVYIARRIEQGKFSIGGGRPGQEVSWQVTGIRQDNWANANRIPVEEEKSLSVRGHYLHPELFNSV